jgi:hypothetical protein
VTDHGKNERAWRPKARALYRNIINNDEKECDEEE